MKRKKNLPDFGQYIMDSQAEDSIQPHLPQSNLRWVTLAGAALVAVVIWGGLRCQ